MAERASASVAVMAWCMFVCWCEQILCLIGEAFDGETDEICGAVINVRMKGDKIAVWTRDAKNADSNMRIG